MKKNIEYQTWVKKIIIMRDDIKPYHDNNGFYIVGLMDFLLKPDLIEQL